MSFYQSRTLEFECLFLFMVYDYIIFCVLYMLEKNIVDLELLVVFWESTAAV